ncbi:partner of SLD PSF2 family protein [Cryptosporidium andersoni]|uniref:Partner of SLD PSF2 family protein n=1 Tax=Cryptosporidium andersoni TaxID=117008 RepID=A0A1J4MHY0_9CRYT|nr:partner of SLD PSF2 family protein [Cryptosporidium andersoni]
MDDKHIYSGNISREKLTFEECVFIAEEKYIVDIIPTINMTKKLIFTVEIGPFVPFQKCKVPLWIAKYLDLRDWCHVVPPLWLTVDGLKSLLEAEEKLGRHTFGDINFHFYEIAHIFFSLKNDPFNGKRNKIRKYFEDLTNRRQAKLKAIFKELILPKIYDVTNIALSEMQLGSQLCFHIFNDLENLWLNSDITNQNESQEISQE